MKNNVTYITMNMVFEIKKNSGFLAEIDGADIKDGDDYLREISQALKFPEVPIGYNSYSDMITDLSWINEKDEIVLIIYNYIKFLKDNLMLKNNLLEEFKEEILPFWEYEVVDVVVGGKPRSFNIYLID